MPRSQEEIELRRLLATYVSGPNLYYDDGELQDSSEMPFIDYLRDSAHSIGEKLMQRSLKRMSIKMTEGA